MGKRARAGKQAHRPVPVHKLVLERKLVLVHIPVLECRLALVHRLVHMLPWRRSGDQTGQRRRLTKRQPTHPAWPRQRQSERRRFSRKYLNSRHGFCRLPREDSGGILPISRNQKTLHPPGRRRWATQRPQSLDDASSPRRVLDDSHRGRDYVTRELYSTRTRDQFVASTLPEFPDGSARNSGGP